MGYERGERAAVRGMREEKAGARAPKHPVPVYGLIPYLHISFHSPSLSLPSVANLQDIVTLL
jgi:hypothetical protein